LAYLSKEQQVRSKTPHKTKTKKKSKKVPTPIPVGPKECACGCGQTVNLSIHHVFWGSGVRKLSSKYKCVEWLEWHSHQSSKGVHGSKEPNYELDYKLKVKHQKRLIREGMGLKSFIDKFGANYASFTLKEFIEYKKRKEKFEKIV